MKEREEKKKYERMRIFERKLGEERDSGKLIVVLEDEWGGGGEERGTFKVLWKCDF